MPSQIIPKNAFPFGTNPTPETLSGFPEGKIRIRLRNNDVAWVFIRTDKETIRCIPRQSSPGHWYFDPNLVKGRNIRAVAA